MKLSRIFCSFLLVNLLTACTYDSNNKVNFQLKYRQSTPSCEAMRDRLMLYLSGFRTKDKIAISADNFADREVVLLGADCTANAWQVNFDGEVKAGDTLHFELGVPFHLNHNNPLTAQAPLNVSEMFWSWQLGHKFLRYDGDDGFSFHLGSTGCQSASRLRPATKPCRYPNRFQFKVVNYQLNKPIVFDLDRLLAGVDKGESCMSDNANTVCQVLFANLTKDLFYQE